MGRLLLVILVAAAALASPDVRAWLQPHVQPALDPVYEWSTRSRVSEIARVLNTEKASGRAVPDAKAIQGFLETRFPGGGSLDPWGTPYYLRTERRRGQFVGSAGRDLVPGTADDIRKPLGGGER
jgi:hypothetical protein